MKDDPNPNPNDSNPNPPDADADSDHTPDADAHTDPDPDIELKQTPSSHPPHPKTRPKNSLFDGADGHMAAVVSSVGGGGIGGGLGDESKTQSISDLVQKISFLKLSARSNSVNSMLQNPATSSSPSAAAKSGKASRPILSVKPPRLDTKKITIIASNRTPDFSPLSAIAHDRAVLFLELCFSLHESNHLPPFYTSWLFSKDPLSIRVHTARTFQTLQTLEFERQRTPAYSMRGSHAAKNAALNRYADVAPYDHCRVILNSTKSNYINASFVTSLDKKRRYIATQGPLPSTFGDFWSMVWDQHSAVIVMLSKEEESGRLKCHRYWPDRVGDTKRYYKAHDMNSFCFKVWYSEEIPMLDNSTIIRELIVTRELVLQEQGAAHIIPETENLESRMVRIVYFAGWNDHDVCDSRALISLVNIANEINSAELNVGGPFHVGPMVVHCSAGIGRTGTFCTADSIFSYLETVPKPDIVDDNVAETARLPPDDLVAQTVNNFRRQRPGFIQTSAQYHLLYEIILLRLSDLYHN